MIPAVDRNHEGADYTGLFRLVNPRREALRGVADAERELESRES